jgi:hypothetical protein
MVVGSSKRAFIFKGSRPFFRMVVADGLFAGATTPTWLIANRGWTLREEQEAEVPRLRLRREWVLGASRAFDRLKNARDLNGGGSVLVAHSRSHGERDRNGRLGGGRREDVFCSARYDDNDLYEWEPLWTVDSLAM